MEKFIVNPVKLGFDPLDLSLRRDLREVFENKLARTLWMGIRQRHISDQYFETNCLKVSKIIEKDGIPESKEKLDYLISRHFGCGYSKEFIEELFPYVSGEKNLEYEVVK
jgi:hypothetical protein